MKKYLSIFLAIIFVVVGLYVQPVVTRGEIVYNDSYGNQLGNAQESLSRKIYDEMVSNYIYQENDEGNTDGKYTGLAEPIKNNGEIMLPTEAQIFSKRTESKEEFEKEVMEWFVPTFKNINEELIAAVDAFIYDYPQVFWIKSVKLEAKIIVEQISIEDGFEGEATVKLVLKPIEYSEGMSENITAFNDAVCEAKNEIIKNYGIYASTHKADIARYLQDYIATKVQYNFDAAKNPENTSYVYAFTPLPVFMESDLWNASVVCEGYSKSFKILCEQFGLKCALLVGYSIDFYGQFEYHEWNAVEIEGKWYAVDVTWDNQSTGICYNYFLAGKESKGFYKYTYEEDHIAQNVFSGYENSREFVLPDISNKGYYINGYASSAGQDAETTVDSSGDENNDNRLGDNNEQSQPGNDNNKNQSGNNNQQIQSGNEGEQISEINNSVHVIKYHWLVYGIKKSITYTGKRIKQQIKITCGETVLKEDVDYKISYKNNVNAGKAYIVFIPIGKYEGIKSLEYGFNISKAEIKNVNVKKVKWQKYKNGKAIKPKVTLKYNGKKLKKGKDYTVSYKNNKNKGTGKIVIRGKGNFKGKRIIKFKIE